uniref:Uncharacterized protein n=1 Tax=Theileria annulata TaxID=5874 RepID=A0A3B0MWB4_THEAN
MANWSSYSESFYKFLLETDFGNKRLNSYDNNILNQVIDGSCSNISVLRSEPKSSCCNKDVLFSIPGNFYIFSYSCSDSLNDGSKIDSKNDILNFKLNNAKVIYKCAGNHTSRRIQNFHTNSGNVKNNINTIPFEESNYTHSNISKYGSMAIPKSNLFNLLQLEVVNSMDAVCIYNSNKNKVNNFNEDYVDCSGFRGYSDNSFMVFMPSGVNNAGIKGLELVPEPLGADINLNVKEVLTIYPSCFFSYQKRNTEYFMDPYIPSDKIHKIESSWDGLTIKSNTFRGYNNIDSYSESNISPNEYCKPTYNTVMDELDILELKADNKSIFSSTVYSRNSVGVYVFRFYYDDEWKVKTINNVSYTPEEKVFYISISPYLPDESAFLTTSNKLLIYDGNLGHESSTISLSNHVKEDNDIIQTVCYGMDNNSLILGGNKLYIFDKRSNEFSDLILQVKSAITVTSGKWTERKYDVNNAKNNSKNQLGGRLSSFSNYWRRSKPSFWESFTACEVHPENNFILAAVFGTTNSILILDLRIPNTPLLDIPLPSTEFMGSRIRSIKWSCAGPESSIHVFSWRLKLPIVIEIQISSSVDSYSMIPNKKYSYKHFENADFNHDTLLVFNRAKYINFLNVDQSEEDHDFPSYGPSIQTQKDYFELPIHATNDSAMTNIFHGYLGLSMLKFKSNSINLCLAYTTSGRLLCIDLDNRKIILNKRKLVNQNKGIDEIGFSDPNSFLCGFNIRVKKSGGIPLPTELCSNGFTSFTINKTENETKYNDFIAVNLSDVFIRIQEQRFLFNERYSNILINSIYLDDFKINKFNSKAILKGILSLNYPKDYDDGSIMSLSKYVSLYGKDNFNFTDVWNPLDNSLDYEYESEIDNPFSTFESCSCSGLSQTINEPNYVENHEDGLLDSSNTGTICKNLIEKLKNEEPLMIDRGVSNSFGDILLIQSNIGTKDNYQKVVEHRTDCPSDEFLSIEVGESNQVTSIPIVEEILSSWTNEHGDKSAPVKYPVLKRNVDDSDPMEMLKEHKRKQKQFISKIFDET